MATDIKLGNPNWDFTRSKYEEVSTYPFMDSPTPMLIIIGTYLLFVLKVGPAMMKDRKPYQLNNLMIGYNFIQVIISMFLVYRYLNTISKRGLLHSECYMSNQNGRKEVFLEIWLYLATKISELLDTVFFVLRKKNNQISFLHLYHHTVMALGTWAFLKYAPADNYVYIGLSNSLVHVFMYSYYGLAAMGPEVAKYLVWKKYITTMQLIQFVSMILHYFGSLIYSECPPSIGVATFFCSQILFFLYLFTDFYRRSYAKRKNSLKEAFSNTNIVGKIGTMSS